MKIKEAILLKRSIVLIMVLMVLMIMTGCGGGGDIINNYPAPTDGALPTPSATETDITIEVVDAQRPVNLANIKFVPTNIQVETGTDGKATTKNMPKQEYAITVSKTGYIIYQGIINPTSPTSAHKVTLIRS